MASKPRPCKGALPAPPQPQRALPLVLAETDKTQQCHALCYSDKVQAVTARSCMEGRAQVPSRSGKRFPRSLFQDRHEARSVDATRSDSSFRYTHTARERLPPPKPHSPWSPLPKQRHAGGKPGLLPAAGRAGLFESVIRSHVSIDIVIHLTRVAKKGHVKGTLQSTSQKRKSVGTTLLRVKPTLGPFKSSV